MIDLEKKVKKKENEVVLESVLDIETERTILEEEKIALEELNLELEIKN